MTKDRSALITSALGMMFPLQRIQRLKTPRDVGPQNDSMTLYSSSCPGCKMQSSKYSRDPTFKMNEKSACDLHENTS